MEKGEHTTIVKAMCRCSSTNQVITLAEGIMKGEKRTVKKLIDSFSSFFIDGTIRSWDADTCKLIWERESDFSRRNLGWHGIATSPFGRYPIPSLFSFPLPQIFYIFYFDHLRYIIALEQISGVYDQMYKARNATGKFWTIPTGDPRPIVELILLQGSLSILLSLLLSLSISTLPTCPPYSSQKIQMINFL